MHTATHTWLPPFCGVKHLAAWLRGHPRGREILDEVVREFLWETTDGRKLVDEQADLRAAKRHPVLVVVGTYTGDYPPHTRIRCYSTALCEFEFVQTPHATTNTEELSDQYVSAILKARHRELFEGFSVNGQPGLQAEYVVRRMTAEDMLGARLKTGVIEECRRISKETV